MQFTKLVLSIFALAVVSVSATPTSDGYICDFGGDDLCNTVCKQEGHGKGGRCIRCVFSSHLQLNTYNLALGGFQWHVHLLLN
jgi:hypothetical protein